MGTFNTNDLVYIVIDTDAATGAITDAEILTSKPTWGASDVPTGTVEHVRAGHLNGGDTSAERTLVGTGFDGTPHPDTAGEPLSIDGLAGAFEGIIEAAREFRSPDYGIDNDVDAIRAALDNFEDDGASGGNIATMLPMPLLTALATVFRSAAADAPVIDPDA